MEQGVMCFGVITEMTPAGTKLHHVDNSAEFIQHGIAGDNTEQFYTYTVHYTDAFGNQKMTTTYQIVNYNLKDVGKRCTVYEHEGIVIVDSVER